MKRNKLYLALAAALFLSGCASSEPTETGTNEEEVVEEEDERHEGIADSGQDIITALKEAFTGLFGG